MMPRFALLLAFGLLTAPASAGLPQGALDEIALAPPPNAVLPIDAMVRDAAADPASEATTLGAVLARHPASLLVFADYTCNGVCGTALAMAADAFAAPDMNGLDAGLVVIGLDPADDRAAALAMRDEMPAWDEPERAALLLADAGTIARLTAAVGYRYRYDFATDQFAHPAAALAVAPDGRAGRPLAELSLRPETLRRALVEASEGRAGTLLERIALRCYSFDPATGLYTADATRILRMGGVLTLGGLAALLLVLFRRDARRRGRA